MNAESSASTARIVAILFDCGMIAREELEMVRRLIREDACSSASSGKPGEAALSSDPRLLSSLPGR